MKERGVETFDDPLPGGFSYGIDGREVARECYEQVGEPKISGLDDGELRTRYEDRVDQFHCLVKHGLMEGEPMSFERFVEDYRRSGETELWSPDLEAASVEVHTVGPGPTDLCPRPNW